jgi:hypothetical protein
MKLFSKKKEIGTKPSITNSKYPYKIFIPEEKGVNITHINDMDYSNEHFQVKSFVLAASDKLNCPGVEGTQVITVISGSIQVNDLSNNVIYEIEEGQVITILPETAHEIATNEASVIQIVGTIGAYSNGEKIYFFPNYMVRQEVYPIEALICRDIFCFPSEKCPLADICQLFDRANVRYRNTKNLRELLVMSEDRSKALRILGERFIVMPFKFLPSDYQPINKIY